MAWRQGQSYSQDLRARVLVAVDGGMAARAAAAVYRVSVSYIYKALIRRRRTGEVSASSRRGHPIRLCSIPSSLPVAPIRALKAMGQDSRPMACFAMYRFSTIASLTGRFDQYIEVRILNKWLRFGHGLAR